MLRFIPRAALPALVLTSVLAGSMEHTAPPSAPNAAYDRISHLAGTWKGTSGPMPVEVVWTPISGGTAMMEELRFPQMPAHNMVTVFYRVGSSLMLTHYCAENNQPRMKASSFKGSSDGAGTLSFDFVDVTNAAGPDATYMHHASYEFAGPDKYTTRWTARTGKKDGEPIVITLERAS